jgi:hypothetical protein
VSAITRTSHQHEEEGDAHAEQHSV